jgi:hypothetical protein
MNDPAPRGDNEKAIIIILACGSLSLSFLPTYYLLLLLVSML